MCRADAFSKPIDEVVTENARAENVETDDGKGDDTSGMLQANTKAEADSTDKNKRAK